MQPKAHEDILDYLVVKELVSIRLRKNVYLRVPNKYNRLRLGKGTFYTLAKAVLNKIECVFS